MSETCFVWSRKICQVIVGQSRAFFNCLSENETKMQNDAKEQLEPVSQDDETLLKAGRLRVKDKFSLLISHVSVVISHENLVEHQENSFHLMTLCIPIPFQLGNVSTLQGGV